MSTTTEIPGMPAHAPCPVRGILTWSAPLPDDLQRLEDATQAHDHACSIAGRTRIRPATGTERALLSHIGHEYLPDDLVTHVSWPSPGVRRRVWPALQPKD